MTKTIPPKITVLVEGETEENYWRSLNFLGKPKKVNLWNLPENKLNHLLISIQKNEQVIIIADTDDLKNSDKFIKNFLSIKRHCKLTPIILLQCQNLEDELCYSCSCKIKNLFECFNATGLDNFKHKFKEDRSVKVKLSKLSHYQIKMWERSCKNIPNQLKSVSECIYNHSILLEKCISF